MLCPAALALVGLVAVSIIVMRIASMLRIAPVVVLQQLLLMLLVLLCSMWRCCRLTQWCARRGVRLGVDGGAQRLG